MINSFSAMILAAGFGKRMFPLTEHKPKPLLEVNQISLLKNCINFLEALGCKQIVINTHYKHKMINEYLINNFSSKNIKISYEKNILDTGGGLKNAIPLFDNHKVLVTNADIFWQKENLKDVIKMINNFNLNDQCNLLLVKKNNVYGLRKNVGDFVLINNKVRRWNKGDPILFYSGLQIINLKIMQNILETKFSFNKIWDDLIKKDQLFGSIMSSLLFHVGDLKGLEEATKLST